MDGRTAPINAAAMLLLISEIETHQLFRYQQGKHFTLQLPIYFVLISRTLSGYGYFFYILCYVFNNFILCMLLLKVMLSFIHSLVIDFFSSEATL